MNGYNAGGAMTRRVAAFWLILAVLIMQFCFAAAAAIPLPKAAQAGYDALKAHDPQKAAAAFEGFLAAPVPADIPAATYTGFRLGAMLRLGECYLALGEPAKALAQFEAVHKATGGEGATGATALYKIGTAYTVLGEKTTAQDYYLRACLVPLSAAEYRSAAWYVKLAYQAIVKARMKAADYKALLDTMVANVPAVPEHAEFLGLLKSEQEKLK